MAIRWLPLQRLPREAGGTFILLDEDNRIGRVAVTDKESKESLTFDFSTLRGTIEQDLCERDFTIDALAIDMNRIEPESLCFTEVIAGAGQGTDYRCHGWSE